MVFDKIHVVAGIRVHRACHLTEFSVVVVDEMDCCCWTDIATLLNLQFTVAPVVKLVFNIVIVIINKYKVSKDTKENSPVPRSTTDPNRHPAPRATATICSRHTKCGDIV